jgi:hypothetical protein
MSEEKTGKIMPQTISIEAIKDLGKEFKPSGSNIKAIKMQSSFLFQDSEDDVYQGDSGDVIYIEKSEGEPVAKLMSGDDFDANFQKV